MYANAGKLKEHSFLKVEVVNNEVGRALSSYKEVGCKPTRKGVCVVMGDKTEHALLVAEVGVGGLVAADKALAAADNAGNNLVADLYGVARGIHLYVFTERDNLARSLVSEGYGDNAEWVSLPLVYVGSANAAALYFYEYIVVLKRGNGKFLYLNLFLGGKHCNLCGFGDFAARGCGGRNLAENTANNCFHLAL